jgi:hypothetical protein
MARFFVAGTAIELPGIPVWPKAQSRDPDAWMLNTYSTVLLLSPVEGIRVHTDGRSYPGRPGSSEEGAWVALGDVIVGSGEFASSRSLPSCNPKSLVAFTRMAEVRLPSQCVLNIGLASPKFGGLGGGVQAEYVSGPPLQFGTLRGKYWHDHVGHA